MSVVRTQSRKLGFQNTTFSLLLLLGKKCNKKRGEGKRAAPVIEVVSGLCAGEVL